MKLELTSLLNKEVNKSAMVIGLGPSLRNHIDKIKSLPRDKFVIIGCNDIDTATTISFDYWVWANSESTIEKTYPRLNSKKAIVVYSDSVDLTPRDKVNKVLTADYWPYDQRHHNAAKCGGGRCCNHIIPGRLTIQEEFRNYTKSTDLNTNCDTVAIPMMYLAVLLGCKKVYVTGVDLDYAGGYVDGKKNVHAGNKWRDQFQPRILDSIKTINKCSKNIGVNVYCIDKGLAITSFLEYSNLP